jgi:hypothetical protein
MLKQLGSFILILTLATFVHFQAQAEDELELGLESASTPAAPSATETNTNTMAPSSDPAPLVIDEREPLTSGQVTLEQPEDYTKHYKQRRGKNAALFSINTEKFYPSEFYSLYGDAGVGDIIQEERISLVGIELGYKRNFSFGSLAILGNYSQGSIDGSVSGTGRNLSFVKQGISANYAADVIFNEPYVVPYIQGGLHQFLVTESKEGDSQSASAGFALNYRFGVLFQIDWLEDSFDKSAKADRLRSSGLENTYIDVFMSQYLAASNAADSANPSAGGDPNLSSSGELGVGLKLEF